MRLLSIPNSDFQKMVKMEKWRKIKYDTELFETATIIDSLMRPEPRIYQHNPKTILDHISKDINLFNPIRNRKVSKDLKEQSYDFIEKNLTISKEKYQKVIDDFFDNHEFNPKLFKRYDVLNSDIRSHPSILWNLQQLRR